MTWDEARNNITIWSMRVEDERILNEIPHVASKEDEEVLVFYLEIIDFFMVGHMIVTNQMLKDWGVSVDTVYQQAFENMATEKFFTDDNKRCMWRYIGLGLLKDKMYNEPGDFSE